MTSRHAAISALLTAFVIIGSALGANAQDKGTQAKKADNVCSTPPFSTPNPVAGVVTITLDWKELHDCLTSEPAKGLGNRISTLKGAFNPEKAVA